MGLGNSGVNHHFPAGPSEDAKRSDAPGFPAARRPYITKEHKRYVGIGSDSEQLLTSVEVLLTRPPAGTQTCLPPGFPQSLPASTGAASGGCQRQCDFWGLGKASLASSRTHFSCLELKIS